MRRSSPFVVSLGESTPTECEEFGRPPRTQTLLDLLALTALSLTAPRPAASSPRPDAPGGGLGMAGVAGTEPRGEGKGAGRRNTRGSSGA